MLFRKTVCLILAACLILFNTGAPVLADDPVPVDESKYVPKVKLASQSTIQVHSGALTDVVIELKNVGTGRAANLFIQAVPEPDYPFSLSFETMGGSDIMQAGTTKRIKMTIDVERGAAGKVYPVKLNYSYINDYRVTFTETDTINIKVDNPLTTNIRLYNFVLLPSSLRAGETAELSFNYMNMGSKDEKNVRLSLDGLDSTKITVPDGLSSQELPVVRPYTEEKTSFKIMAAPACKNGSYPIKLITEIKSSAGEAVTEELTYYVNVGGAAEKGDPSLEVVNRLSPSGAYGVGESINVAFDIQNTSDFDAENVIVKVNPPEDGAVVPTSQSMFITRTLKAGERKGFSFTFAATSAAKSQNYPLSFTIEYDAPSAAAESEGAAAGKISFSHFFGANITNSEADKKEEEGEKELKNIPKIIVSSYACEPTIVKAGDEFDLSMTFMNSHSEKLVKNIKVSLTVTDKDEKVGASIFSPVNASNTIYIDEISPKQTTNRTIRYYAIPDANPQTYSINVNFEYEDAEGNQIKEQEIVGVNVSQPPSVETSEIAVPEFSEAGVPIFLNFEIYNTGKVSINNVRVTLEGDMQADAGKTIWIGNMDSGSNQWVDASFYYFDIGPQEGRIVLSYDSVTGEHFEVPTDFSVMISEPLPMDMEGFEPDMPAQQGIGEFISTHKPLVYGGASALVIAAAAVVFFVIRRKRKNRKDFEFDE